MSFALILDEIGDGRYTVELDYGEDARNATVDNLDAYIVKLQATKVDNQAIIDDLKDAIDAQLVVVTDALNNYIALTTVAPDADPTAFAIERRRLISLRAQLARKEQIMDKLDAEIEHRQRQRTAFAQLTTTETVDIWCTTHTTGAAGYVATIDIPGDDRLILIAPSARTWTPADGILFERALCDPNQAYVNAALQAGWQSQEPTYRTGVITAINFAKNTASVTLDDATMTRAPALDINQKTTLTAVPVEYLSCGANVFEVDDHVVVQFVGRSWDNPKIIGFVTDPRPCSPWYAAYWQPGGDGIMSYTFGDLETGDKDWPVYVADMAEACMATDLVVRVRFDRGAWITLTHLVTLNGGGYTPRINQYYDAAYPPGDGPFVQFTREPNFGGTNIEPDYAVGAEVLAGLIFTTSPDRNNPYLNAGTIEALVQTPSGVTLFNAAHTYDVADSFDEAQVRVFGGIRPSPAGGGSMMTILTDYALYSETLD